MGGGRNCGESISAIYILLNLHINPRSYLLMVLILVLVLLLLFLIAVVIV